MGTTVFEVWSVLESVKVSPAGFEIKAPFPVKARGGYLSDPPRAYVDLLGARFDSSTEIELPASARISQYKPDVVRVVLETDARVQDNPSLLKPQRGFSIRLGASSPTSAPP